MAPLSPSSKLAPSSFRMSRSAEMVPGTLRPAALSLWVRTTCPRSAAIPCLRDLLATNCHNRRACQYDTSRLCPAMSSLFRYTLPLGYWFLHTLSVRDFWMLSLSFCGGMRRTRLQRYLGSMAPHATMRFSCTCNG
eukprot:276580-Pyramimonas_sp.AAC.1